MDTPVADPSAASDMPPRTLKRLRKAGTSMQVCCVAMHGTAV